jgi:hypothetical protein
MFIDFSPERPTLTEAHQIEQEDEDQNEINQGRHACPRSQATLPSNLRLQIRDRSSRPILFVWVEFLFTRTHPILQSDGVEVIKRPTAEVHHSLTTSYFLAQSNLTRSLNTKLLVRLLNNLAQPYCYRVSIRESIAERYGSEETQRNLAWLQPHLTAKGSVAEDDALRSDRNSTTISTVVATAVNTTAADTDQTTKSKSQNSIPWPRTTFPTNSAIRMRISQMARVPKYPTDLCR